MGGLGSGVYPRMTYPKRIVERCHCISSNDMPVKKMVEGKRYEINWTLKGRLNATIGVFKLRDDLIALKYVYTDSNDAETVKQYKVKLTFTKCNYGGQRIWFLCPHCGRRVMNLYQKHGIFLCRHCHNLSYWSRNQKEESILLDKVNSIRKKIGGIVGATKPFPDKPRGMWWKTYFRLKQEHDEYLGKSLKIINRKYTQPLDTLYSQVEEMLKNIC